MSDRSHPGTGSTRTAASLVPVARGVARATGLHWRLDAPAASPAEPAPLSAEAPLVVCLHGMRMHEDSFARLVQGLLSLPLRCLGLRGAHPAPPLEHELLGASWYAYDGDQEAFRRELLRVESEVVGTIAEVEREQALAPRARILLGFSQGGYCGAFVALRHPELFQVLVVSGARVKTEVLERDLARAAQSQMSVLLCHGARDASVLPAAAEKSRDALLAAGLDVTWQTFPTGHSLGRAQVQFIAEFLRRRLPALSP